MNPIMRELKSILEDELICAARTNDLDYLFQLFNLIAEIGEE